MIPQKTSIAGIAMICHFEDCRLEAYRCPAGIPTVGFGHTGAGIMMGLTITLERAKQLLAGDLHVAENAIAHAVHVPLTQGMVDALISLVFNIGAAAFRESVMLGLLNQSDFAGASQQFARWCHAGAEILPGLVARRAAEREMFLS